MKYFSFGSDSRDYEIEKEKKCEKERCAKSIIGLLNKKHKI